MTPGAREGDSKERLAHDIDLIIDAVNLVLSDVDGLMHFLAQEPKAGGDDRLVSARA